MDGYSRVPVSSEHLFPTIFHKGRIIHGVQVDILEISVEPQEPFFYQVRAAVSEEEKQKFWTIKYIPDDSKIEYYYYCICCSDGYAFMESMEDALNELEILEKEPFDEQLADLTKRI
jgi:hypothetical protein